MPRGEQRAAVVLAALLIGAVLLLYAQTSGFGYVFDDVNYIVRNPGLEEGLSWFGVRWAFTTFYHANWHPVAWIAHLADRALLGPGPGSAHLVNAGCHAACAVALFLTLRRMTGVLLPSALAAALFALHPLRVESVAWVTERKDALSTIFWLLAMGAWVRYARRPSIHRYALVAALFALGLMTKAMVVTFPVALLLLDWWPLGRLRLRLQGGVPLPRLLLEKVPLLLLSAGAAVATFFAQRGIDAVETLERYPGRARIANSLVTYVIYLTDTLWPVNLAVYYPHPGTGIPTPKVLGAALLLALLTYLALRAARTAPALATGWLWYLGTLVPVIGLVQVGAQGHADRYTYLPSIGLVIALVWGAERLVRQMRAHTAVPTAVAVAVLGTLAVASWRQVETWRDDVTLFTRAIAVTRGNWLAEYNLGLALADRGDTTSAMDHFRASLRIQSNDEAAHFNLGICYAKLGRPDDAMTEYRAALQIKPNHAKAHINLGAILADRGQRGAAIEHYKAALRESPELVVAHMNLANALSDSGAYGEALAHFDEALRLAPADADIHINRGVTYVQMGRLAEAETEYREALRLDPGNPTAQREIKRMGAAGWR